MGKSKPSAAKKAALAASGVKAGGRRSYWPLIAGGGVAVLLLAVGVQMALTPEPVAPPTPKRAEAATSSGGACEDVHELCEPWHKAGYCRSKGHLCRKTCGRCKGIPGRNPLVPRESRCQRDNQSAAVPAFQLNALFKHTLEAFPQYSPEVLSEDPWVVKYNNFLSAEEAAAFQEVCRSSFERSLAGDQLNPVRTSFQCWCNFRECFTNEHVHRVTRRINELIGIPYNNGEDLQIVRYEPGQFYRAHHDQNTAVWTPQGPRVLTFFMYLNEPTSGGETAFPRIKGGIKVEPTLGSAILWPSTFDEHPMSADERTLHEAMPVHEGIKFGANMWVHQFSFKTPSERGCELTYVNTVGDRPQSREHEQLVRGLVPTMEETVRQAAAAGEASRVDGVFEGERA